MNILNSHKNKHKNFSLKHVMICLLTIIISIVLIGITVTFLLWHSKKETCDNLSDVYVDVTTILTQDDPHLHKLETLCIYLSSHRLDHILYEWRKLRDTDIILGDLEHHIVLQSENFTTDANTLNTPIPIKETWLLATCRNVTYHSNPTELDYTRNTNFIDIMGYSLYSEDQEHIIGYVSKLNITLCTTENGENYRTEESYTADFWNALNNSNPTELDALYDTLQNNGRYFDFAVLQYMN